MIKYTKATLLLIGILSFIVSCANIATPAGGDYDFDPPKVVKASPDFNSVFYRGSKVTLVFDENIALVEQSEKVLVTPPQKNLPIIRSVNNKLTVELRDTLLNNTTYTIDFTDAITDNNEGNVLENFAFSFSTGQVVDTLSVSGIVLSADNLEPLKGMFVGLHSNLSDTAFTKERFLRISRTNDAGMFTIRGVAPGKYKIYALNDSDRDYMYGNPSEIVAFLDTVIEPTATSSIRMDTISVVRGKFKVDSISTIGYTRFMPDDLVLRTFKSSFARQYLAKHERVGNKLNLFFGAPTEMGNLVPMSFDVEQDWAILEKSLENDTLTYWIKSPEVLAMDTLAFQLYYNTTDTLNQHVPTLDTLKFVDRTRPKDKKKDKKKKEDEEEQLIFLTIKSNASSSLDIYQSIHFEFEEPLADQLNDKLIFSQLKDTTYYPIPLKLAKDTLNPRKYFLSHKWEYGAQYKIGIDSAAVHSIYGLWNDKFEQKMKVKMEDEYGNLAFMMTGLEADVPAFVELLDKSDNPVRRATVKENAAVFKNIVPGTYYARVIIDRNGNGKWDTGDYHKGIQPEVVSYFREALVVNANWDNTPPWVIDTVNLKGQKPADVTKNKPKDKQSKREQLEKRDNKQDAAKRKAEEQIRQQSTNSAQSVRY